jgi:hypothetical protein
MELQPTGMEWSSIQFLAGKSSLKILAPQHPTRNFARILSHEIASSSRASSEMDSNDQWGTEPGIVCAEEFRRLHGNVNSNVTMSCVLLE